MNAVLDLYAGLTSSLLTKRYHNQAARTLQVLVGFALFGTGLVFWTQWREACAYLGIVASSSSGETELRTFYGAMEMGLGLTLVFGLDTHSALIVACMFLFSCAVGRVSSASAGAEAHTLHVGIAGAESLAFLMCLWGLHLEKKDASSAAAAKLYLTRRQRPNPTKLADFVPYAPENVQNPYPFYRALRREAPVVKLPGMDYWLVSRAEDIHKIVRDTDTFSSNLVQIMLQTEVGTSILPQSASQRRFAGIVDVLAIEDPPIHTGQRKAVMAGINSKLISGLETTIRDRAKYLIQSLVREGRGDFMSRVANKLPMYVALQLCGFPCEEKDVVWSKQYADRAFLLLNSTIAPSEFSKHISDALVLFNWIKEHFKAKQELRKQGKVEDEPELIKALLDGIETNTLSVDECNSAILQILLAGNDSSAATMGNAVKILCDKPEVQQALRKDPSKIPGFIEEVLRFESPFVGHFRKVMFDAEVNGVTIPAGDRLMLLWGSANRDETLHPDRPEEFVFDRADAAPGKILKHYAFGQGVHQCFGAPLARKEIRVVLEELLEATKTLQADVADEDKFAYVDTSFTRYLARYPVAVEASA